MKKAKEECAAAGTRRERRGDCREQPEGN